MILYKKAQSGSPFKPYENKGADNPEYAAMSKVVNQRNKRNPWIKRKLDGNELSIPDPNNPGKEMSHKLMTGEWDGKTYVYPSVIEIDGKLEELSADRAAGHAVVHGTRIKFESAKFADYYAKNGLIKH